MASNRKDKITMCKKITNLHDEGSIVSCCMSVTILKNSFPGEATLLLALSSLSGRFWFTGVTRNPFRTVHSVNWKWAFSYKSSTTFVFVWSTPKGIGVLKNKLDVKIFIVATSAAHYTFAAPYKSNFIPKTQNVWIQEKNVFKKRALWSLRFYFFLSNMKFQWLSFFPVNI